MSETLTFSCNSSDGWVNKFNAMNTTDVQLYIGTEPSADTDVRTWIPFTCPYPRGQVIISATFRVVGASTGSSDVGDQINIGMEASGNAGNPSSGADMRGRAKTTANITVSLPAYVSGTTYSYDVTAALQEVVNRSDYTAGNQVAVIIDDVNIGTKVRRARSYESGSNIPSLEVTVPAFFSKSAGII